LRPAEEEESPPARARGRLLVFPAVRKARRLRWWERALLWLRYHDGAADVR